MKESRYREKLSSSNQPVNGFGKSGRKTSAKTGEEGGVYMAKTAGPAREDTPAQPWPGFARQSGRIARSIEGGAVIGPSIAAGGRFWLRSGRSQTGPRRPNRIQEALSSKVDHVGMKRRLASKLNGGERGRSREQCLSGREQRVGLAGVARDQGGEGLVTDRARASGVFVQYYLSRLKYPSRPNVDHKDPLLTTVWPFHLPSHKRIHQTPTDR